MMRTQVKQPQAPRRTLSRALASEWLEDRRMLTLATTDMTTGLTPADLAQSLVGPGITVSNVSYTGDNQAAGVFSNGISDGLGIETGVTLSSGMIADAAGPNDSDNTTTDFTRPGDADLDALIPGFVTHDATVLEFNFVATGGTLSFQYVFGSEEYNEFVDNIFNDVFGFFLDGKNIALIPGTTTPVSINNVNAGLNSAFYHNNDMDDVGTPTPFPTQADGFTVPLQAVGNVSPGKHHIKLAIADAGDGVLDSWVFLAGQSFVSGSSDLEITMDDSPDPVVLDTPSIYTLTVTNHGPDNATGVLVQDVLPSGATFLGATSSNGSVFQAGGVVTASLNSLASGASATVSIFVVPTSLGTLTNTATVQAFQADPFLPNNTATQDTTVTNPGFSIDDVAVAEGDVGTRMAVFTVMLNGPHKSVATVAYETIDGTALADEDYEYQSGVLTFAPGVLSRTISVPIIGDTIFEDTELFAVVLSDSVNGEILNPLGIGTILDDEPTPLFYVNDVHVTSIEDDVLAAVFTVALDRQVGRPTTIEFATADGVAQAGIDYLTQSGTLTFLPGTRTLNVTVPVLTSATYAPDERFFLNLANATHAALGDAQGVGTIIFDDAPVGELIIDDGDPGYSPTAGWVNLINLSAYQLDYDYHAAGNGSGGATWTFDEINPGSYQVFVKWTPFSNRATNAPFTILDGNSPLATVRVNQKLAPTGDQSNGIAWQSLGTFYTSTGTLAVRLNDNANGYVIADAVRIVADGIAPQNPEMDVTGFGRSIGTLDESPALEDGTDFGTMAAITGSITHAFTIINDGNADLHLTGIPRVEILGYNPGDFSVLVQPGSMVGAGQGSTFSVNFHPQGTGLRQAVISIDNDDDSEHPYTFAIQGNGGTQGPSELTIDDSQLGYQAIGAWTTNTNASSLDGQYHAAASGSGSNRSNWSFTNLAPGQYDVLATWVPFGNHATNAPFSVADGAVSSNTVVVNQQLAPNGDFADGVEWQTLTSLYVSTGELKVSLSNAANGFVIADAVRIVRQGVPVVVSAAPSVLHNVAMPLDVNGDQRVTSFDALLVISALLPHATTSAVQSASPFAATAAQASSAGSSYYLDVNNDGRVSAFDALTLISYLLAPSPHASASAVPSAASISAASLVAEPPAAAAVDQAMVLIAGAETAADDPAGSSAVAAPAQSLPVAPSAASMPLLTPPAVRAVFASSSKKPGEPGQWNPADEAL